MSSRDAILKRIDMAQGRSAMKLGLTATTIEDRRKAAEAHLQSRPRTLAPARATGHGVDLPALFMAEARRQLAKVVEVPDAGAVGQAVADILTTGNAPLRFRAGSDPRIRDILKSAPASLRVDSGPADGTDTAGLSHATAGIAETGTLVIRSGADNPVTLNFLPETHIVLVRRDDIVATMEDAFDRSGAPAGGQSADMPRTLNFVTGPSRTADIGGKIVIGAHGPRQLAIIVIG